MVNADITTSKSSHSTYHYSFLRVDSSGLSTLPQISAFPPLICCLLMFCPMVMKTIRKRPCCIFTSLQNTKTWEGTARGPSCDAGDDSAAESDAESDASSLSDYGIPSSDPMGRFTVTALPMTNQPPSSSWHSPPQQPPQQLPQQLQYQYQQQHHHQQQQQARGSLDAEHADDSAHNGRLMPELGSEQQSGMRPELAAMRGRADSAHEMPVSHL